MVRTVLVTQARHKDTGELKEIYGRYDAVALYNQGYEIVHSSKQKFEMSDADFVAHAVFKAIVKSNIKED